MNENILQKAKDLPVGFFVYNLDSAYHYADLPADDYKYGVVNYYKRSSNSVIVLLQSENSPLISNTYNGIVWTGWKTYVTNSEMSLYGFPISQNVKNLHNIENSGFFYYNSNALENPVSDRGGLGLSLFLSNNWKTIIVVPYNYASLYIQTKVQEDWSNWYKFEGIRI